MSDLPKAKGGDQDEQKSYTEARIAFGPRAAALGTHVSEIVRKIGVSDQTFQWWEKLLANMGASEIRRF